jgi:uroporphyrinogen III methyltransferase/synthase
MTAAAGTVYLVGAGPGDPGLITVRGLELLRTCDVVLYDRLVAAELLAEVKADAEKIFVGKTPGQTHSRQLVSDALLVSKASEGKSVVRLKGGDPFVFGRGAEEAALLRASSIPFEIVPGVTSATAVPAYAGIPVTHRGLSASFVVLTAREEGGDADPDVSKLSVGAETLVLLMGVAALEKIARRLVESGRDPREPAATIEWGTTGKQKVVVGKLDTIAEKAAASGIRPPATTIVGPVVSLRDSLRWFEDRPLFGRTVAVTRPPQGSRELTTRLVQLGADVVSLPLIDIAEPDSWAAADEALAKLSDYSWVVFASMHAVARTFARLRSLDLDARAFAHTKIACVGERTRHELAHHGLSADLVPERFTGAEMVAGLGDGPGTVLFPRVQDGPPEPVSALTEHGWQVDDVAVYSNIPGKPDASNLQRWADGDVDIVTFTSASTVTNLGAVAGHPGSSPLVVCIGPSTERAAREAGLDVAAVAEPHDTGGLVAAVLHAARSMQS